MTKLPTPIRIPLLGIAGKVKPGEPSNEWPQGLKRISEVEISVSKVVPLACYALEITDIVKESAEPGKLLGIFGLGKEIKALNDIYALGLAGREPLVCKVIKNEARSESAHRKTPSQTPNSSHRKNPRKSFMTPTPLHIPESRVSPIPDSAHEMVYLKVLNTNEALKVVPLRDVVWMHPLILQIENPPGSSLKDYSKTK